MDVKLIVIVALFDELRNVTDLTRNNGIIQWIILIYFVNENAQYTQTQQNFDRRERANKKKCAKERHTANERAIPFIW